MVFWLFQHIHLDFVKQKVQTKPKIEEKSLLITLGNRYIISFSFWLKLSVVIFNAINDNSCSLSHFMVKHCSMSIYLLLSFIFIHVGFRILYEFKFSCLKDRQLCQYFHIIKEKKHDAK